MLPSIQDFHEQSALLLWPPLSPRVRDVRQWNFHALFSGRPSYEVLLVVYQQRQASEEIPEIWFKKVSIFRNVIERFTLTVNRPNNIIPAGTS